MKESFSFRLTYIDTDNEYNRFQIIYKGVIKMADTIDIAKWFVNNNGTVASNTLDGNIKLQKLLYYAQAMHLVIFENKPLFDGRIEAWVNGPVVRQAYSEYRYNNLVVDTLQEKHNTSMTPSELLPDEEQILKIINLIYGNKTGRQLIDLTHSEKPWKDLELDALRKMNPEITNDALINYYFSFKDIYESYKGYDFSKIKSDIINGNIYVFDDSQLDLNQEELDLLWEFGEKISDCSYYVYRDDNDGELVIY
jgi:uncharacterized phage-associated protein